MYVCRECTYICTVFIIDLQLRLKILTRVPLSHNQHVTSPLKSDSVFFKVTQILVVMQQYFYESNRNVNGKETINFIPFL